MQPDIPPVTSTVTIPRAPVRTAANTGRRHGNPFSTYELLKSAWLDQNPNATPAEYAAACQRIAAEIGL